MGRILVNGMKVKNSKNITVGDTIDFNAQLITLQNQSRRPQPSTSSGSRSPLLYAEDMDTAARREQQRLLDQASRVSAAYPDGRPTKRDRRQLDRMKRESW